MAKNGLIKPNLFKKAKKQRFGANPDSNIQAKHWQTDPKWSKMVKNDQNVSNRPKMIKNDQKSVNFDKNDQNGQKLSKIYIL